MREPSTQAEDSPGASAAPMTHPNKRVSLQES